MIGIYIGLALYIAATFGLSIYTGRKENKKTEKEYIVGDKNYGSILTAFSMGTTLASGFAYIGLVGMGYTMGLEATWQCIFGTILEFITWYYLAHKLRRMSDMTEVLTPIEAMSKFHGDPHNLIKIFGGLFIGLFMTFYLAGQFTAGSKAAAIMNLDPVTVAIAIAVLTIIYIFVGGMNAAVWTNAIQGFIMIISFFVLVIVALSQVGGFNGLFDKLAMEAPNIIQWNNGKSYSDATIHILNYWLGSAAGFLAQPQAIQKFITIKNEKEIRKSALLSCIFNIIRQLGPVIIGMAGRIIYPFITDPETVIPTLIVDYIPNVFGGIMMAGIFAAIMSTTESLLLHSTSELTRNFLQKGIWINKNLSEKNWAQVTRVLTVIIGIVSLLLSLYGPKNVFTMIIFAWTGLFTSVGPSLYLGLMWKKCTSWGILSGIITGIPATTIWFNFIKPITGIHEAYSVIIPLAAVIIVSLATQNQKEEDNFAERINAESF